MEMNEISGDFKMTELGPLPEDWTVVPLQKLNSQKKVSLNPANFPDEIFEYYSIPNYQNSEKPSFEQGASILSQKILLNNGAVLFGKLNPRVEKVWKVESDTQHRKIGSTEWFPIFPDNEKVDSDFLYYAEWSKYVMPKAKTLVTGSTPSRQRVDPTSFYKIKIPLPPLSEQQKIAKVLSTVQEAKEKSDAVIIATKDLKKSLMHKLFSEGLNGEEQKETEIGLIPKSWDVVRLGEVVDFTKRPRTLNLSEFKKIPFIPMEMIPIEKLYIKDYLLKSSNEITSGVYCEKKDILLAKITPSFENGKQGIVENIPYDFAFATTEVYPLKPRNNLDKLFLFYFLIKSDVREAIAGKMQGTTGRKRVPKETVENSLIPLPPLPEQQQIAHILSTVDKKIEIEEGRKTTFKELFKTMLHKLMSGEIRLKDVGI